jgi:hypothetical protein
MNLSSGIRRALCLRIHASGKTGASNPSALDAAPAAEPVPRPHTRHPNDCSLYHFAHSVSILPTSFRNLACTSAARSQIGADHQHCIVPGDRAHHLRPFFVIECRRHRLCATHHCSNHDLVHRLPAAQSKSFYHIGHARRPVVFLSASADIVSVPISIRQPVSAGPLKRCNSCRSRESVAWVTAKPRRRSLRRNSFWLWISEPFHQLPYRIVTFQLHQYRKFFREFSAKIAHRRPANRKRGPIARTALA